ncbi:MAG: tRNA (guanosine(37)-N1)-methyltransferase TrmD [Candidatus Nanopelagicales bacterium]|jgi:tRNA (guanine37-N1)-methyltransferase
MRIDIVSIFPQYLAPVQLSLVGRAQSDGLIDIEIHDLRDAATDRHRTVDDEPYGGGPGMVMTPEPWGVTLDRLLRPDSLLVVPTPSGRRFDQRTATAWADRRHLVFACGRYEGIDTRVMEYYRPRVDLAEVCIGDYVLAGGEAATLVMVEAVTRLLPGVVGNVQSIVDDSFADGDMESLLEGPVYTRPANWRGMEVPSILLSGDHGSIARWRRDQAWQRTRQMRPDLPPRGGTSSGPVPD